MVESKLSMVRTAVLYQRSMEVLELARPSEAMAMDDLGKERFGGRMRRPSFWRALSQDLRSESCSGSGGIR
jgi:hypothetical protein